MCYAPRFQRGVLGIIIFLVLIVGNWKAWIGPNAHERYGLRQSTSERMKNAEGWFGQNQRPEFVDMTHLDSLEDTLVPGGAGVDPERRLIAIGDVHGCIDERMSLSYINFSIRIHRSQ